MYIISFNKSASRIWWKHIDVYSYYWNEAMLPTDSALHCKIHYNNDCVFHTTLGADQWNWKLQVYMQIWICAFLPYARFKPPVDVPYREKGSCLGYLPRNQFICLSRLLYSCQTRMICQKKKDFCKFCLPFLMFAQGIVIISYPDICDIMLGYHHRSKHSNHGNCMWL